VEEDLDLDAIENDLYGGSSGKGETFLPGGDDSSSALSSSSASTKPSPSTASSKPALSSLSSAPALKSSSLGSLAPLGRSRPTASSSSSSASAAAEVDSSRESLPEEDARQVAEWNHKIAAAASASSTKKPSTSVESSADYVDESFAADSVEEDLEIEVDYEEEEF
jgi:hypothetical protein